MDLDYDIRLIRLAERSVLRKMLHHAIYVPPGDDAPDPEILDTPELARTYENWGRPGDLALVATLHNHGAGRMRRDGGGAGAHEHTTIGAAWYRLYPSNAPGYGFVAEDVPELSVAVLPGYRGMGVGTALLTALISRAAEVGYRGLSLSVDRRNRAVHLYERLGFTVVKREGNPVMMLEFQSA